MTQLAEKDMGPCNLADMDPSGPTKWTIWMTPRQRNVYRNVPETVAIENLGSRVIYISWRADGEEKDFLLPNSVLVLSHGFFLRKLCLLFPCCKRSLQPFSPHCPCNVAEIPTPTQQKQAEMTKCHRNDVGSLVLDRTAGGSFRLWPAFSGASFRRKLIDTMRCGVSRHRRDGESDVKMPEPKQEKVEKRSNPKLNGGMERLSDLLNSDSAGEIGADESEAETRRKVEAFEELRSVVKRLQCGEGGVEREAAIDVRRLAKEDSEARTTLAMLGAIPPLVGMLDSDDPDFHIAALYALLNLGIGNDM